MRNSLEFHIQDINEFRKNAAAWASSFSLAAVLDSNIESTNEKAYQQLSSYDILIAVSNNKETFTIEQLTKPFGDWLFGHISYENFHSQLGINSVYHQKDGFQNSNFFVPEWIVTVQGNQGKFLYHAQKTLTEAKEELETLQSVVFQFKTIDKQQKKVAYLSQNEYSALVETIKKHILRGDIYEMNFCLEFYAENYSIDPLQTWFKLCEFSPSPFSAFYKNEHSYLISASPERFLKKHQNKLYSQPIKGTIGRSPDSLQDELNKKKLINNPKERAENIMIADLVRNDLTPVSKINSVHVDQLCELNSFKHVHQLISTISSEVDDNKSTYDILKSLFPMGSMTGAPKLKAIKLASHFENFNRGLYSGSVGYFDPEGNFDFNVVIRSILYNDAHKRISLPAGSAITMESNAELEYNECLVKITPLLIILQLEL